MNISVRASLLCMSSMCFLATACGGPAAEEGVDEAELASSKATYWANNIAILKSEQLDWSRVMDAQIKTPNQSALFMQANIECGLLTKTTVKSKGGVKDTSIAEAVVSLRVQVDGADAEPGPVVYCKRTQELSATLQGIIDQCTDANGDGTIDFATECTVTEEEISLLLDTQVAASFGFVKRDLRSGVHNIGVLAKITTMTSAQLGSAEAAGSIGKGSLTVTQQRLLRQ